MTKNEFIGGLKKYRGILSTQTIKTLKGQAVSGDVEAASKGLAKALKVRQYG